MALKLRDKNNVLQHLIIELDHKDKPIWKALAKGLNRPKRIEPFVNLHSLEKNGDSKFTLAVPGVVLGSGELKKKLTVAAYRFSGSAKEKIEKAGGKCLSLQELVKANPDGKGVKILG